jgi:hypothetical protein
MVNLASADPVMRPAAVAPPGAPNELAILLHHLNDARLVHAAQNGHGDGDGHGPVPDNAAARARPVGDDPFCRGGIHPSASPLARGRVR